MLATTHRVRVTVRVPRGAAGDVEGGVREVLEAVDVVERVEVRDLTGVRPDALDLHVDARVDVTVVAARDGLRSPRHEAVGGADRPVDALLERLREGFGVTAVRER